ncbi:P pilus assembly/Cpx signaling pathway, periplasmic inhibitor/zinc-resistance associated protein [Anabaena sp. FACHB-1237]|uniref:Spy/CpxP family protein refolding chaperone n=1 Tax=Anabaena sp. FACHB-1237 TaxID=2692769 RepID=UPI0016807060|nr:P pilus assembly/Cpx signaling pathway, periplasmic inhibitor/zinc-resistance associated protein [Anabaena sp. FACHB-1237]MBD2136778.1 P pilus assembly/Cpx signaling pathway, periplasmic inhibitor/zinc-resistance associated protein [Anabaena sp. FACHB-1237]
MKIKTLSLIAGTFALALTATPFIAQAQMGDNPPPPEQETMEKSPFSKLNLTDAQKAQLKQIHESTRVKIESVLTPQQRAKLEAAKAQMKARHEARKNGNQKLEGRGRDKENIFESLNLTDAQKKEIKAARESAKKGMEGVLTPEQKAKLEKFKQNMRSRQQNGNFQ